MGHELRRLLIEYRELSKLKSTCVDALTGFINPATGRIHTSFNQTGAATGRLSSSDPNLQNIPVRTPRGERSEEHTSELQSQSNLVCRLLLEKKKKKTHEHSRPLTRPDPRQTGGETTDT